MVGPIRLAKRTWAGLFRAAAGRFPATKTPRFERSAILESAQHKPSRLIFLWDRRRRALSSGPGFADTLQSVRPETGLKEDVVANNEFGSSGINSDSVADAAGRAKDQAKRYGQRAMDAVDASRESAASSLDSAASEIRAKADALPGGAQVSRFARRAADKIGGAAQYVREHDVKDVMSEVESFV